MKDVNKVEKVKQLYWWNEIEGFNVRKYSQGKMATAANPKIKAGLPIVRQLVQFLWHNLTKKIIPQISAEVSKHERVSLIMDQAPTVTANDHKLVEG